MNKDKKNKQFGYLFFFVLSFISIFIFFNSNKINYILISLSLIFLIITIFKPILFDRISNIWIKFGELLGILSFGHNAERNSGSFIMTMPGLGPDGSNVSCILGYGLDWQFFYHDGTRIPQEDSL